jgi:hypothetical protein
VGFGGRRRVASAAMSRAPQESVLKVVVLVLAGFVLVYLGVE